MSTSDARPRRYGGSSTRAVALALAALGSQAGCAREFFREWANQDVSEAVFEKSRDPRWRLDLFSVDPPALARFSDPYDPDRPPAPPDDYAAQALSPTPQWPDNRLIIPAEGTGYLDMLDNWQRHQPDPRGAPGRARAAAATADTPAAAAALPPTPPPAPPGPGAASPFTTLPSGEGPTDAPPGTGLDAPNSGPGGPPMTPTPVPAPSDAPRAAAGPDGPAPRPAPSATRSPMTPTLAVPSPASQLDAFVAPVDAAPRPAPAGSRAGATEGAGTTAKRKPGTDPAVREAAFQDTGIPGPTAPPSSPITPAGRAPTDMPTPPIGMDPNPINTDLSAPVGPPRGQTGAEFRATEAQASELAGILVPGAVDFNEAEAAGLPRDSRPYVVSMEQAFTLALINSRNYQIQLEQVYLTSLAVTLQRFVFMPQFYAGLSPLTGVATGGGTGPGGGIPAPNPSNVFTYATRATGAQVSNLNLGTVAGFGKVFSTGARLITGFASSVVFNFIGKHPSQPTVRSYLPLTLVQPLLRGGGRAVTLELLTQAERNLLYAVRSFAKFRQEFTVATLVGGSIPTLGSPVASLGFSGGGSGDPVIGFLNVVEDIQLVENARRNVAAFEQIVTVYKALIDGESTGLTQLQLDQVAQQLQGARQNLVASRTQYRFDLDSFKMQMGLPPDTPLVPDRSSTAVFKQVYDEVDEWQRNPDRVLEELPAFANRLPQLQDVILDGRSLLNVYKEGKDSEDELEDVLRAAERTALEHRLDLMNSRASLYDSWRQIMVTANALQGILNVSLTNTFVTPPNTTNPFAFVDQAKTFSLVINAELPLVRMTERNAFRTALINYRRQRASLQQSEDTIKLNIRNDIRALHQYYLNFEIQRRNFVLLIRQKDQAFEQIIAPPATGGVSQGAVQTNNLNQAQSGLINTENQLITTWYSYQQARLALYRDLGTLPYDEWEAFSELFPAESVSAGPAAAASGAGITRATAVRAGEEGPPRR